MKKSISFIGYIAENNATSGLSYYFSLESAAAFIAGKVIQKEPFCVEEQKK